MSEYIKARLGIQEDGRSLAEYALILGLIAVVAIGALTLMGTQINVLLDSVTKGLGG